MMKRALFLGLGVLSLTREKAEKVIKEMVEKGDISADEGGSFVDDLIKRGEEANEELKKFIKEEINYKQQELSVVTREEFEELKKRVDNLEMRLR
jgi:polyhydroxyalkanoate synthesis regulator phasin